MTGLIAIKGIKQGVLVTLNDTEVWDTLLSALGEQLQQRASFFKGAQWVIDVHQRSLDIEGITELKNLLTRCEVEMLALLSTSSETLSAARELDLITDLDAIPIPVKQPAEEEPYTLPPVDSEEYGTGGVLIKRTLRSGRTVRSAGHVVVIGDVNSGAEIEAVGDVIIWGKLRGTVHAGVQGDETAVICALDLAPTQLRIASLITIPPQDHKRRVVRPEMARINNGQIEAIPWGIG